ncbi:MAG: hypothetical protein ACREK6_13215 [Candidatus Rokuibacteriota bacterium]
MTEKPRRRRARRDDRVEGQSLIDVAREAFIRHLALDRWRDLVELRETSGLPLPEALDEAGCFAHRWPYHALWRRRWQNEVVPFGADPGEPGALFAAIERATAGALDDEEADRRARGDRPLAEDQGFRAFLDGAYGKLHREAAGGLEPA